MIFIDKLDDWSYPRGGHWFKDLRAKAAELAGRVNEITIPTLVFWGELDVMFDPSNAKHLDAALPNSKLQILPEAGHLVWADQPELFADMIIDWVEAAHPTPTYYAQSDRLLSARFP